MSQQQNDARFMCEYPIYGTVSDVSHMSAGVIYVRPCYFKPGVDKEIALFLRDAKKERWAIADNLKVGTKLTFRIKLDPYKGPMATDLKTVVSVSIPLRYIRHRRFFWKTATFSSKSDIFIGAMILYTGFCPF